MPVDDKWAVNFRDYGEVMDHVAAQDRLDRDVAAWMSYEPSAIGELFSDDVAYRYHAYDEPVRGREAVIASWLGEGPHDAETRDDPGTFEATYTPVAVDGDVVVATGSSHLSGGPRWARGPGLRQLLRDAVRQRRSVP